MSKKSAVFAGGLAALTTIQSAWAVPSAFPNGDWNLAGFENGTTSSVLADSDDPNVAWVLPPTAGTVTPSALTGAGATTLYCKDIVLAHDQGYDVLEEIGKLNLQLRPLLEEAKKKQDAYYKKLAEAEAIAASNSTIRTVMEISSDLENIRLRLDGNYDRLNTCGDPAGAVCVAILDEIKQLQAQEKTTFKSLAEARKAAGSELKAYDQKSAVARAAKEEWEKTTASVKLIRKDLNEAHDDMFSLFAKYAKFEGGYVDVLYDTGWDANIAKLAKKNPGFDVKQIQTQDVRVNASLVPIADKAAFEETPSIVMGYSINGKARQPYGPQPDDEHEAFPSVMTATFRLNLIGACPMLFPEKFDLEKSSTGLPIFGISASYLFPETFSTKVKFSYNLYKFYELIKRSGSKGGFFSTKSWSETIENQVGHDTFKAEWEESDPENLIPEDKKREIESQVKTELMTRVLNQMAIPVLSSPADIGSSPAAPQSGAIVLADGIGKTCGMVNIYCAGASFLLRGLDAIFGSSKVEDTFRQTRDYTATEIWSRETTRLKPGITVFARKK